MTLRTLSLGGLEFVESDDLATGQYVTVRTGPGDNDFVNVFLGDFRSFMTRVVNERLDDFIDGGGGGPNPSIWPTARTLTLAGPITGATSFDGSSNFTLQTHIADGALTVAKVAGLQATLNTLASRVDQTFSGTTTLQGDLLPDLDNTHSLGSPEKMWRDVYIGPGSLYINGQKVLEENSGTIQLTADPNQNIAIQTSGSGDIELAPTGTGVIQLKGSMSLLGGSKIRSSNGKALLFDDAVDFNQDVSFIKSTHHKSGRTDVWASSEESSPSVMLRTETGSNMGALLSHRSGDWIGLRRYNPSTGQIEGELSIKSNRVLFNERELYHTGNLDTTSIGYLAAAVIEHGSTAGVDCNNFTAGTKYLVHNANANTPGSSSTHWYVETLLASAGSGVATVLIQRAWSTTSDELHTRRRTGGSWSAWRRTWNSGNFNPSSKLDSNATAAAAAKWSTARKLTLTGAISGEVSMDGSGNVSLATSVSNLTIANITGLRADLDSRALSSQAWQRGTSGPTLSNFGGDLNTLTGFGAVYAVSATNSPLNGNVLNFGRSNYNAQLLFRSSDFRFRTQENGTWQEWLKIYHSGNLDLGGYITSSRRVLAGNGLTGGGALSSDQTLTLGTPGTLSGSTTNAVTSGSHTHALSANLKAWDALAPSSKWDSAEATDRGLGNSSYTSIEDFNELIGLRGARFFSAVPEHVNGPNPSNWFHGIHISSNGSSWSQIASRYGNATTNPELWIRHGNSTGPSTWARLWDEKNLDPSTLTPTSRSIAAGNGLSGGGNLTANRTLTLGTPSAITLSSTNSVTTSSHTHAFTPGGTTSQYIRGDGSLATFPSIPAGTVTSVSGGNGLSGSVTTSGSISLGTPGTITNSTTNSVTSTSHTHALSISKADVGLGNVENVAISTWNSNYITDSRGAVRPPSYYERRRAQWDFQNKVDTGAGGDSWTALLTVSPASATQAGTHVPQQLAFTGGEGLKFRRATSDSAWSAWENIVTGTTSTSEDGNTIPVRNGSGDIYARLFRSTYANQSSIGASAALAFRTNDSTDNYIRFVSSSSSVRDWLSLGTTQAVTFQNVSARAYLYCGQASVSDSSRVYGGSAGNMFIVGGNTTGHIYLRPRGWSSTNQAYLNNNGSFYAVDFILSSDASLKENVDDLTYRGRLRPVEFDWRDGRGRDFGFIANEVQELYPMAVKDTAVSEDEAERGVTPTLTLSYSKLTAILSAQLNDAEDRIVALEDQLKKYQDHAESLQDQMDQLRAMVQSLI